MFRRLANATGETVPVTIDGTAFAASAGDTVAAALLIASRTACRLTSVSGMARGPYCMMGVCFDCLVTIDGVENRQGCLVAVRPGMRIETQRGKRRIG